MNALQPLHLVDTYGAFGSITSERYEVIVEGTTTPSSRPRRRVAGVRVQGQAGRPARRPRQFAPYHLRLDWLMWFAALSPQYAEPWFARWSGASWRGRPGPAAARPQPFPDAPPGGSVRDITATGSPPAPSTRRRAHGGRASLAGDFMTPVTLEEEGARVGAVLEGQRASRRRWPPRTARTPRQTHPPADRLIPRQPPSLAQQQRPVVLAAAHQRQLLRPRVLDVDRDVPAVLAQPPERHGRAVPVTLAPERHREGQRNEELHQGAAEERRASPRRRRRPGGRSRGWRGPGCRASGRYPALAGSASRRGPASPSAPHASGARRVMGLSQLSSSAPVGMVCRMPSGVTSAPSSCAVHPRAVELPHGPYNPSPRR